MALPTKQTHILLIVTFVVGSTKQQVYCDNMHAVLGDFSLGNLARVIQLGQRRQAG
jgi:hypothetical protein